MDPKKSQKYEGIDRIPSIKPQVIIFLSKLIIIIIITIIKFLSNEWIIWTEQLRKMKRKPEMKRLHYDTTVRSRYARTTVTGLVKNYGDTRDVNVNVILPHNALITKFET